MALYDDAPAPRQILAGRIAYGVLGVGTTGLLASYLLWGPTQAIVGLSGAGLILLSGVPAVIQMAQNSTASRARRPTLALLPRPGGAGLHVVGAFR